MPRLCSVLPTAAQNRHHLLWCSLSGKLLFAVNSPSEGCGVYITGLLSVWALLSKLKIFVMQREMPIADKTKETWSSPAELYFFIEHFFLFVLWFVQMYVSVWMFVLCVVCSCAPVHGACLCTDMWGPEECVKCSPLLLFTYSFEAGSPLESWADTLLQWKPESPSDCPLQSQSWCYRPRQGHWLII